MKSRVKVLALASSAVIAVISLAGCGAEHSADWSQGYQIGVAAKQDAFASGFGSTQDMCQYKAQFFNAQNTNDFVDGCVAGFDS